MSARWIKIGGFLVLAVIGGVAVLMASRWPFTRDSIIKALQEKFSSTVESKTFDGTYFTPGCVVEGLTFRRNNDQNAPPIATVKKLTIQGSYWGLLTTPKRIRRVRIEGLRVFISPRSTREGNEARPPSGLGEFALIISEIISDGAVVEYSDDPGTEPLRFDIHKLTLNTVADDRPMSFHATLRNPTPPGEIRIDGQFGPLRTEDVGNIVLSGSYVFQHGDLGVFPGIGGIIASTGKFNGVLQHVEVAGDADAPDFRVTRANHAVHVKAQFHAIVNGMDGDVALQSVQAQFDQTSLLLRGEVATKAGAEGKTASLETVQQQGRIQDWLRLFAKAERPTLTGPIHFKAQIMIPPGKPGFFERVHLEGDFAIDDMRFTRSTQAKLNSLSQLAQGQKENDDQENVIGNLEGHVVLKDTIATLSDLSFSIPGALAHVHGTYGVLSEKVNFHGTLQVDSKLSKGSTGMRSFLLKLVEPFMKKKNAGEIIPIKVGGTFHDPSYGLDLVP